MNKYNSILNTFRVFDDFKNKCKNKAELYRDYAFYVLHNRFPDGEPIIAKDPYGAYEYAKNIIKGRFPAGEPTIARDPDWAYWYARDVIKGRFPAGEPAIAKNPVWAYKYAKDTIKGRFPMGEKIIFNSHMRKVYEKFVLKKENLTWKDIGYGKK